MEKEEGFPCDKCGDSGGEECFCCSYYYCESCFINDHLSNQASTSSDLSPLSSPLFSPSFAPETPPLVVNSFEFTSSPHTFATEFLLLIGDSVQQQLKQLSKGNGSLCHFSLNLFCVSKRHWYWVKKKLREKLGGSIVTARSKKKGVGERFVVREKGLLRCEELFGDGYYIYEKIVDERIVSYIRLSCFGSHARFGECQRPFKITWWRDENLIQIQGYASCRLPNNVLQWGKDAFNDSGDPK